MNRVHWLAAALVVAFVPLGCADSSGGAAQPTAAAAQSKDEEAEIQANLAGLSPKDRKLAQEQRFCPVETENRLGAMGPPVKVEVKGQTVFLCCKGCRKRALAHPDETLATIKELKASANGKERK